MLSAERTVRIDRPAHVVFDFLADGSNAPRWRTGVRSISLRSGAAGQVGAEYAQQLDGPGGRSIPGDYRITRADRPGRFEFEVIAGPLRPRGVYSVLTSGASSVVTFALTAEPTGFMRLMTRTIRKTMAAEVAQLMTAKRILEETPTP